MIFIYNIYSKVKASKFLKSFSWLTLGEIGSRFFNIFTNIILARWLAPEKYGKYSLYITYIAIFAAIASLGLRQLIIREIARHPHDTKYYLGLSVTWRLVGFLLACLVFLLFVSIFDFNTDPILYFIILGMLFMESAWDMFQNVAYGLQRMQITALLNISTSASVLLIYILLPRSYITVNLVMVILLSSYFVRNVIYYGVLVKGKFLTGQYRFNILGEEGVSILRNSFPFYILVLLGIFTNQFPVIFLEYNTNLHEVAFFNTANKILLPMTMLLNSALAAFFPSQAILFQKDVSKFGFQTKRTLFILVMLGIFMSICVSLFRNEVVLLLYGKDYGPAANVLAYQCWYFVFFSIFCVNGSVLGAANKQKQLSILSILYAIISTPLLYFFSFKGAEGLAIGYLVASTINLFIIYPQIVKVSFGQLPLKFSLFLLGLLFVSIIISLLIPQTWHWIIRFFLLFCFVSLIYVNRIYILNVIRNDKY
jgi:O-antigen/teichoic acid export membrane protein